MEPDSMPLDPMTTERPVTTPCAGKPRLAACLGAAAAAFGAGAAHASFLSGEALDTAADVLAWVVIVLVPLVGIAVFWIVHVLPEKIAHKRHHPQRDAIHVLCLLSLVFGGLLWPIAWLWAYTRPTLHRMAFGTEKHEDYFVQMSRLAEKGELGAPEIEHLRHELDVMAETGMLPAELRAARERLASAHPAPAGGAA